MILNSISISYSKYHRVKASKQTVGDQRLEVTELEYREMYPFLHGYKQQIIYECKIKTCVRAQNLKNLMLCNKKHKAQESCSSEKYEKNSFKTTYLFQHILERQKRPHSLYLHIVYSFSKRNCLSQVPAHAVKQCRTNRVTPISKAAFRELSSS